MQSSCPTLALTRSRLSSQAQQQQSAPRCQPRLHDNRPPELEGLPFGGAVTCAAAAEEEESHEPQLTETSSRIPFGGGAGAVAIVTEAPPSCVTRKELLPRLQPFLPAFKARLVSPLNRSALRVLRDSHSESSDAGPGSVGEKVFTHTFPF